MHMKQHLHFAKGNFFMQYGLLMFCVLLIPLLIFYGIFTAYYFHNNRTELERSAEKVLDNSSATISGCFSDLDQMYSNFIENEKVADYMLQQVALARLGVRLRKGSENIILLGTANYSPAK